MLLLYCVIIHLWVSSQCISKDRFPLGSHILKKNRTVDFSNTCVEQFAVEGPTVFTCWTEAQSIDRLSYEESRAFEKLSCTGVGWIRVVLLFDSWLRVWSYLYSHQFRNNWFPTFQPTGISLSSDFRMTLKNGFGECLLFLLSANERRDQNRDSSFSGQRKPLYGNGIVQLPNRVAVWCQIEVLIDFWKVLGHEDFFTQAFA